MAGAVLCGVVNSPRPFFLEELLKRLPSDGATTCLCIGNVASTFSYGDLLEIVAGDAGESRNKHKKRHRAEATAPESNPIDLVAGWKYVSPVFRTDVIVEVTSVEIARSTFKLVNGLLLDGRPLCAVYLPSGSLDADIDAAQLEEKISLQLAKNVGSIVKEDGRLAVQRTTAKPVLFYKLHGDSWAVEARRKYATEIISRLKPTHEATQNWVDRK